MTYVSYMWTVAGIALMKPTSFLLEMTLTPQCHWGSQPGGRKALEKRHKVIKVLGFQSPCDVVTE